LGPFLLNPVSKAGSPATAEARTDFDSIEDYYKMVSAYAQADLLNGLDGMSLKLLGFLGWSAEKVQEFFDKGKSGCKEYRSSLLRCYVSRALLGDARK
jgi:hypothetical protein